VVSGVKIEIGSEFIVKFPFYKGDTVFFNGSELQPDEAWIPGCKSEYVPPDDSELVADGEGQMILTVVDVHKPGRYQERVFYTRRWIDPDGCDFGIGKLHIITTTYFKHRASGYYHEYRLL